MSDDPIFKGATKKIAAGGREGSGWVWNGCILLLTAVFGKRRHMEHAGCKECKGRKGRLRDMKRIVPERCLE